jgi:hypothetical protein
MRRRLNPLKWLAIIAALLLVPAAVGQSIRIAGVTPNRVVFASQTAATTSDRQLIVLSNGGDDQLHITRLVVTGDFDGTHDCPEALPSGAECRIWVFFKPSAAGVHTGQVTITDDAGTQKVSLRGTGTPVVPGSLAQR